MAMFNSYLLVTRGYPPQTPTFQNEIQHIPPGFLLKKKSLGCPSGAYISTSCGGIFHEIPIMKYQLLNTISYWGAIFLEIPIIIIYIYINYIKYPLYT